jgi:hypothetical protein
VALLRRNARGERKIVFDLGDFALCDFFLTQVLHKSRNISTLFSISVNSFQVPH